uniref:DUF755 domain-containing protein n=1 Tax=Anelloviridae sp. TaxID=2055263 RepID=A0A890CAE0_9VIRU|nr:hypothetical protein [Anelloviridae sp.]
MPCPIQCYKDYKYRIQNSNQNLNYTTLMKDIKPLQVSVLKESERTQRLNKLLCQLQESQTHQYKQQNRKYKKKSKHARKKKRARHSSNSSSTSNSSSDSSSTQSSN